MSGGNPGVPAAHLYLALQSLLLTWLIVQDIIFGLLFFIIYVQTMVLVPGRMKLAWMLLLVAIVTAGIYYLHPGPGVVVTPALRAWMFQALLTFITLMLFNQLRAKRKSEEINYLLKELTRSHRRLQEHTRNAELLAAAEERNRIARDLHDALGHRLTASVVQTEGLLQLLKENKTQQAITTVQKVNGQLHEGLQDLRATHRAVRLPNLTNSNLSPMLQRLADDFVTLNNANVHLQLPDALPPSLTGSHCIAVYRLLQEALTNTARHAPRARNVWVNLEATVNELTLAVRNDGRDFTPPNDSDTYGLQGMQDRAANLGGTLTVKKPNEGGTLVTLTFPLAAPAKPNLPEIRMLQDMNDFTALPAVEKIH